MSDSPFGSGMDPEALIAQVERQVLEAELRAESASQLVQQIEAIDVEGQSRGKEVRVRVDASGRLTGIQLDQSAASLSLPQLEAAVMEAVGVAQRRAANSAIELAGDVMGDGLAQQLRGEYESRLGALEEEETDGSGSDRERRPY